MSFYEYDIVCLYLRRQQQVVYLHCESLLLKLFGTFTKNYRSNYISMTKLFVKVSMNNNTAN